MLIIALDFNVFIDRDNEKGCGWKCGEKSRIKDCWKKVEVGDFYKQMIQ